MKSSGATGCSVFLALFALPFAAVGVGASGLIYYTLVRWVDVMEWQETPARILTVDVNQGENSISTEATYEYQWHDARHTGDQVSLHFGSDNIGSFQERVASELTNHKRTGQPFRCFVDASDPARSILYRDLRWEMLSFLSVFGTIFGTVGLGLLFGTLMSISDHRAQARLREQYPAEPWRWKPEWSDRLIRPTAHSWLTWLAAYWVIVALPGGIGAVNAIAHGRVMSVFGLIIPVIAFLIARSARRKHRRRKLYGESRVQLDRFPAITGGLMSGTLLLENDVDPRAVWRLHLQCKTHTGSGEDSHEHVACEIDQTVERTERSNDWGRSAIPFEFVIPYTAPQTDLNGSSKVEWKLSIRGEEMETEYNDEFVLPVFQTKESSRKFKRDKEVEAERARVDERLDEVFPDAALTDARLRIREQSDGTLTVIAPAARYMKPVVCLGLFVVFWDSICVLLWNIDAPILFPIVFSLGGLLVTYCWVDLLLSSARVEIGPETITFRHGWPGLAREHRVERGDIKDVTVTSNMSIGSTQYPNVKIHVASGKPMTVMSLIRGRPAADRLAERILEALVRD